MHAHGVDVLDKTDRYHLIFGIPHDLQFQLLPAQHGLFNQYLADKTGRKTATGHGAQFFHVIDEASPRTAHRISGADHHRVPQLRGYLLCSFNTFGNFAVGHLYTEFGHCLLEGQPVFTANNSVDLDPDDSNVVFLQNPGLR